MKEPMEHSAFPSDETLAAFIDGRLDEEMRKKVVAHVADCEECYGTVMAAGAWKREGRGNVVAHKTTRVWWLAAASLASAAAVTGLFLSGPVYTRYRDYHEAQTSGLRDLVVAADQMSYRTVEARLPGGFAHRSLQRATRGGPESANYKLLAAASHVKDIVAENVTPASIRALSTAHLLVGDSDAAADELTQNIKLLSGSDSIDEAIAHTNDASLLIEITAVFYRRSLVHENTRDLMTAAAAARRASQIAPSSPEAAWNRALTLEAIGSRREALEAWKAYLRLDPTSKWSDEAKGHISTLSTPTASDLWSSDAKALEAAVDRGDTPVIAEIARRWPLRSQSYVQRRLLERWTSAMTDTAPERANSVLRSIAAIGGAVAKATGDFLISDFAKAAEHPDDAFVRATTQYVRVGSILRERGTRAAIDASAEAAESLRLVGSPFYVAAIVDQAGHCYHDSDHERALSLIASIRDRPDLSRYVFTHAAMLWVEGVALTSLGRVEPAAVAYRDVIALYKGVNDQTNIGTIELMLAENAALAGADDVAWTQYMRAAHDAEATADPARALLVFDTWAVAACRRDPMPFALVLQDVVVGRAREAQDAMFRCHALITRCDTLARLGELRAAESDCREATSLWSSVKDPATRDRLSADLDIARSRVGDRSARLASIDVAVAVSERPNDPYRLARLLGIRAKAYSDDGAPQLARADLERGLEEIEKGRAHLELADDRRSYFENSRALTEDLARNLISDHRYDDALSAVERGRVRGLLDRAGIKPGKWDVGRLQSQMPPRTAILEIWVDAETAFEWLVRADGITFARVPRPVGKLTRDLESLSSSHWNDTASDALYDAFLRPLDAELTSIENIVVVCDGFSSRIPFPALRDRQTSTFAVQRWTFQRAPSAIYYVASASDRPVTPHSLLALVDPDLTPDAARHFERVGRTDTDVVLSGNSKAVVIRGADATPARLMSDAPRFELVYVAAHTLSPTPETPEPALLLAPDETHPEGILLASEIERMSLRPRTIAVLASCSTMRGRVTAEETLSVAYSFVAAGAGSVVASLWDVGDREAPQVLRAYYAALANGAPPARALRNAQIACLHNSALSSPSVWAAFAVYGGGTS
jgi:CHAT domain-containing protein/tetratricopeptide (TPR) repeat protein